MLAGLVRRQWNGLRDFGSQATRVVGGRGGGASRPPLVWALLVWALFFPEPYVRLKLSYAGISPTADVDRCLKQRNASHVLTQSRYDAACAPICGRQLLRLYGGICFGIILALPGHARTTPTLRLKNRCMTVWPAGKGSSATIDCWATLNEHGICFWGLSKSLQTGRRKVDRKQSWRLSPDCGEDCPEPVIRGECW